MELKRLLSFVLVATMLLCAITFSVSAGGTGIDRSIVMTPSDDEVKTGETVTITVSVSDTLTEGLKFASWELKHDDEYFEFVSAELVAPYSESNVTLIYRNGNVFTPDVYAKPGNVLTGNIMVYTFKALMKPVDDKPFEFGDVDIRDGNEGWTEDDVSDTTQKEETDVTINIRLFDDITTKFDGTVIGASASDTYDGQPHEFKVIAYDDEDNDAPITYTINGEPLPAGETSPTFIKAGEYLVRYTIAKDGYQTIDETVKITIDKAEVDTQFKFAGKDITVSNNRYSYVYDGNANKFEIAATTVDSTTAKIEYSMGEDAYSETPYDLTTAGTYEIKYRITAENHKTINESFCIIIEPAPFDDIKIGFTDGGITKDITSAVEDGAYEFPYDGEEHELVVIEPVGTVDNANVDIQYSIDGITFTDIPPSISDAGRHQITYKITADNHATETKTIIVTITDPKYVVEVLLDETGDWIEDDKLVLVYTEASKVTFKYDQMQMFDVSGGKYKYNNEDTYAHVFALVVPALGTENDPATLEDYDDFVTVDYTVSPDFVIDYTEPCDLNGSGEVNQNDIIAAYSILEQQDYAQMKGIIKFDSDFSKTARDLDVAPIINKVYFSNN